MKQGRWNDPEEDLTTPGRVEERAMVRDELAARLRDRGIELSGDESDEQVVELVSAVDEFELAVARVGGDSIVNDAESSQPDDRRLVVPTRRADEPVGRYLGRIRDATKSVG